MCNKFYYVIQYGLNTTPLFVTSKNEISFKHSVCQIRVEFTDYEDRFFNSSVAFAISARFNT